MYLYYYINWHGLCRDEVVKETSHYYMLKNDRVSKKTMTTGSGWDSTHYYIETPELRSKYEKQVSDRKINAEYDKMLDYRHFVKW